MVQQLKYPLEHNGNYLVIQDQVFSTVASIKWKNEVINDHINGEQRRIRNSKKNNLISHKNTSHSENALEQPTNSTTDVTLVALATSKTTLYMGQLPSILARECHDIDFLFLSLRSPNKMPAYSLVSRKVDDLTSSLYLFCNFEVLYGTKQSSHEETSPRTLPFSRR